MPIPVNLMLSFCFGVSVGCLKYIAQASLESVLCVVQAGLKFSRPPAFVPCLDFSHIGFPFPSIN